MKDIALDTVLGSRSSWRQNLPKKNTGETEIGGEQRKKKIPEKKTNYGRQQPDENNELEKERQRRGESIREEKNWWKQKKKRKTTGEAKLLDLPENKKKTMEMRVTGGARERKKNR